MKKNAQRTKLTVRAGSYSLIVCVIVIAIVVALNVLVGLLPTSVTTPDVSTMQLYDFTEQTEEIAKKLDENITIYHWIDESNTNYIYIEQFLERFSELNPKITVKKIYPEKDPTFIYRYVDEGEEPATNSLVFESGKRFKIVNYGDMFSWSEDALYNAYMLMYQYGYSYEQILNYVPYDVFSAENAVVNAIDYVTTNKLPVIYLLRGHGESDLETYASKYIADENYSIVKMEEGNSLLALEAVPADANCVLINSPTSDLTEDEFGKLMAYMERGGSIVFLTNYGYDAAACPTFAKLCEAYGLEKVDGLVLETSGYYYSLPFNIIANKVSHEITDPLIANGSYVYVPLAHGIRQIDSYRSSLSFSTLLETSENSYSKLITENLDSYDKAEGDIDGKFALGVLVEEQVSDSASSRFFWFSSSLMFADNYASEGSLNVLLNTLAYGTERVDSISIRTITLSNSTLDMSDAAQTAWTIVLVAVIPVMLIAIGFVVWFVRRQRR
ncbi:MAG: Gldg family protein [Clostridiales bacterium]|nr:Gldg family protein [Clostridiales bacterium]